MFFCFVFQSRRLSDESNPEAAAAGEPFSASCPSTRAFALLHSQRHLDPSLAAAPPAMAACAGPQHHQRRRQRRASGEGDNINRS